MIVNIIICYNQISNKLESGKVKNWIKNFVQRLVEASRPDFPKEVVPTVVHGEVRVHFRLTDYQKPRQS